MPYGRAINPITGSNWEGVGVEPHIAAQAEDALKTAHLAAVEHLAANCQDEDESMDLAWLAEIIESGYTPVVLDEADLARCTGEYGKRTFFIQNGALFYGHSEFPDAWKLLPMTGSPFRLGEDVKFEFTLGEDGKASAVKIYYRDGRPEVIAGRTG